MALEHIDILMHNKGHYWIVEGDITANALTALTIPFF